MKKLYFVFGFNLIIGHLIGQSFIPERISNYQNQKNEYKLLSFNRSPSDSIFAFENNLAELAVYKYKDNTYQLIYNDLKICNGNDIRIKWEIYNHFLTYAIDDKIYLYDLNKHELRTFEIDNPSKEFVINLEIKKDLLIVTFGSFNVLLDLNNIILTKLPKSSINFISDLHIYYTLESEQNVIYKINRETLEKTRVFDKINYYYAYFSDYLTLNSRAYDTIQFIYQNDSIFYLNVKDIEVDYAIDFKDNKHFAIVKKTENDSLHFGFYLKIDVYNVEEKKITHSRKIFLEGYFNYELFHVKDLEICIFNEGTKLFYDIKSGKFINNTSMIKAPSEVEKFGDYYLCYEDSSNEVNFYSKDFSKKTKLVGTFFKGFDINFFLITNLFCMIIFQCNYLKVQFWMIQ